LTTAIKLGLYLARANERRSSTDPSRSAARADDAILGAKQSNVGKDHVVSNGREQLRWAPSQAHSARESIEPFVNHFCGRRENQAFKSDWYARSGEGIALAAYRPTKQQKRKAGRAAWTSQLLIESWVKTPHFGGGRRSNLSEERATKSSHRRTQAKDATLLLDTSTNGDA
jgi:hypothetical protein